MYNHYVRDKDGNYINVGAETPPVDYIPAPTPPPKPPASPKAEPKTQTPPDPPPPPRQNNPQQIHRPPEMQFANKMLGHLNLSDIDSGDLLLLSLLFFLFRQKADEELLIALGLLLIL